MKKMNKKGFTLMEMLIVVAIIGILVAISIPVFSSQLDKVKKATDDANFRSAKSVATVSYLTDPDTELSGDFDAGTATFGGANPYKGQSKDLKDQTIGVSYGEDGTPTVAWSGSGE